MKFRVQNTGFKVTSYELRSLSAMAGSGFQTRNPPSAGQARNLEPETPNRLTA